MGVEKEAEAPNSTAIKKARGFTANALAVDSPGFLQDGFHDVDEIYEVPRSPEVTTDVAHPAGVN